MYKNNITTLLLLTASLITCTSNTSFQYNPIRTSQKKVQTKAKVSNLKTNSLDSAQVKTDDLQCQEAQVEELMVQNATIQRLAVEELQIKHKPTAPHYSVVHTFQMRDFFRVGSSGFKAVRTIKSTYEHPLFIKNEIRGWKMTEPNDKDKDNDPLYVTEYVPAHNTSNKRHIILEAHFIIPQSDAPKDGNEQFIKLGVWINNFSNQSTFNKPALCFFESEEALIPTESEFGESKIVEVIVRTMIPGSAIDTGFTYILLNRIAVTENKKEFDHKQGVALNMLTIRYPD